MIFRGDRLRSDRQRQGFNQQEFADRIGVTHQCIANIETGVAEPSLRVLSAMCHVLNASADWLLDIDFEEDEEGE